MLPLHHAPTRFRAAEHESLRSQYAGEPATGRLGIFVATRVKASSRRFRPHNNVAPGTLHRALG